MSVPRTGGLDICTNILKTDQEKEKKRMITDEALPVYVQIAQTLKESIEQGVYKVEDRLPSEHQLSDRFGVNRHTLRRAIALLKEEGLLRVDKGRGIFVAADPILSPIGKRVRYNNALQTQGRASYQLLRTTEMPADAEIAKKLEIPLGDPVAVVDILGLGDRHPLNISTSYFPLHRFPDILQQCQNFHSISHLLKEVYGCEPIRRQTNISARLVRPQDARLLKIALNQPILLVESVNVERKDAVIEYGITRFRGDGMKLVLQEDRD